MGWYGPAGDCGCCDVPSSSSSSSSIDPCECDLTITAKCTYVVNVLQDEYQMSSSFFVRGHSALSGTYEHTFTRTGGNCTKMPTQSYAEFVATTEWRSTGGWNTTNTSVQFDNFEDPCSVTPESVPNFTQARMVIAAGGTFYLTRFFHFICFSGNRYWFSTSGDMSVETWTRDVTFNDFSGTPAAEATLTFELIRV